MPRSIKIIKNRVPLINIVPPMIVEIIQEQIAKYTSENGICKFNVEFGYIEESVIIDVHDDVIEQGDRGVIMTYQAKVIELFLLDHYKINSDVYAKIRNREIIRFRQIIQFFLSFYADMPLETIGFVTGKKDHCTVIHSKKQILKRIDKGNGFKKEMFFLDRQIFKRLGVEKSLIFDIDTSILKSAI